MTAEQILIELDRREVLLRKNGGELVLTGDRERLDEALGVSLV